MNFILSTTNATLVKTILKIPEKRDQALRLAVIAEMLTYNNTGREPAGPQHGT